MPTAGPDNPWQERRHAPVDPAGPVPAAAVVLLGGSLLLLVLGAGASDDATASPVRRASPGRGRRRARLMLPGCGQADPASSTDTPSPGPAPSPGPIPSPGPAAGGQDTAQTLRDLETTRLQALVDADTRVLEAVHAPDFQLIPPPGLVMSRDEYLAAVETGQLDYLIFEPVAPIEVSVHDDTALLTYRSRIHIDAEGQGELEHDTWHTYLYEQTDADFGWQLVWEQATAVGGFPPA